MNSVRKRLGEIHDKLYAEAEEALKLVKNICGLQMTCKGATCSGFYNKPKELCCGGCKFHNPDKGCQAEKPLMCKTWLCNNKLYQYPHIAEKLGQISDKASRFGLIVFRGDKEMNLNNAERCFRRRLNLPTASLEKIAHRDIDEIEKQVNQPDDVSELVTA